MKSTKIAVFFIVCLLLATGSIGSPYFQKSGNRQYYFWYTYDQLADHARALVSIVFDVDPKDSSKVNGYITDRVDKEHPNEFSLPVLLKGPYDSFEIADSYRSDTIKMIETLKAGHGTPIQWTTSTIVFSSGEKKTDKEIWLMMTAEKDPYQDMTQARWIFEKTDQTHGQIWLEGKETFWDPDGATVAATFHGSYDRIGNTIKIEVKWTDKWPRTDYYEGKFVSDSKISGHAQVWGRNLLWIAERKEPPPEVKAPKP